MAALAIEVRPAPRRSEVRLRTLRRSSPLLHYLYDLDNTLLMFALYSPMMGLCATAWRARFGFGRCRGLAGKPSSVLDDRRVMRSKFVHSQCTTTTRNFTAHRTRTPTAQRSRIDPMVGGLERVACQRGPDNGRIQIERAKRLRTHHRRIRRTSRALLSS